MRTNTHKAIVAAMGILVPFLGPAEDLRIIDESGTTNEMKNVGIDYTIHTFVYTPDVDYNGIRINQGEATVSVAWARIQSVTMASGTNAQIVLTSGVKKDVELACFNAAILKGDTDLGHATVSLNKIKSIEATRKK